MEIATTDIRLRGHVFDRQTNLPVPGATVSFNTPHGITHATTDLTGDWIIALPVVADQVIPRINGAILEDGRWDSIIIARAVMMVEAENYRYAESSIQLTTDPLIVGLEPMFDKGDAA